MLPLLNVCVCVRERRRRERESMINWGFIEPPIQISPPQNKNVAVAKLPIGRILDKNRYCVRP